MDSSSNIFLRGRLSVGDFLQKLKGKSIPHLIYVAIRRIVNYLILARYSLQYPNVKFGSGATIRGHLSINGKGLDVKFGSGVTIRGHLSIEGKGQVEIGNNCSFVTDNGLPNKIIIQESSARITIGDHCYFYGAKLSVKGKGQLEIGNYCTFATHKEILNKIDIIRDSLARVTIGEGCYFNGVSIVASNFIELKRQCLVSDALILDTDFHSVEINRWDPKAKAKTKPVYVGENVWIAGQSVILKGVTIGNNSVIGLGTIVRQSVPDNVIVIGNPQKIVKELDTSVVPYEFPGRSSN